MFGWLYKRIIKQFITVLLQDTSILPQVTAKLMDNIDFRNVVIRTLQDEKVRIEIVEFTDEMFTRYSDLAKQMVGSYMAKGAQVLPSVTGEIMPAMPAFLNTKGGINMKALMAFGLNYFLKGKGQPQDSNRLP